MRVKAATVQKFMLGAALLAGLAWNLAHASEIRGLDLAIGATGTRADIRLDAPAEFKVIRLKSPERLVIDLPASTLVKSLKLPAAAGVVQSVRTGQPTPGTVRIVFDLSQPVAPLAPRIEHGADGARLVVEWPGDGAVAVKTIEAPPKPALAPDSLTIDPARASAEATTRLISELVARDGAAEASGSSADRIATANARSGGVATVGKAVVPAAQGAVAMTTPVAGDRAVARQSVPSVAATDVAVVTAPTVATPGARVPESSVSPAQGTAAGRAMRPLTIAIDAGHGGQDPGAVGLKGSREKDVTLAIARELARQINATPGLKAYLTRDTDVFLPLPRRAQLARQARADMFVSIHADAAENRAAHGSSVYVLSTKGASSQRARWLADKENASDLIGGVRLAQGSGTLASVLLDLTQSGHMKASEDAASQVLAGLRKLGRNHKPSVERANFAVLRTSDMPSMLVETAFISNPEEEKRLTNPAHQKALASAVLEGINAYFTRQPPPGTMFAMRAQAQSGAAGGSP
jgi:N-acetylmuramoyl-L-alanine amidase